MLGHRRRQSTGRIQPHPLLSACHCSLHLLLLPWWSIVTQGVSRRGDSAPSSDACKNRPLAFHMHLLLTFRQPIHVSSCISTTRSLMIGVRFSWQTAFMDIRVASCPCHSFLWCCRDVRSCYVFVCCANTVLCRVTHRPSKFKCVVHQ